MEQEKQKTKEVPQKTTKEQLDELKLTLKGFNDDISKLDSDIEKTLEEKENIIRLLSSRLETYQKDLLEIERGDLTEEEKGIFLEIRYITESLIYDIEFLKLGQQRNIDAAAKQEAVIRLERHTSQFDILKDYTDKKFQPGLIAITQAAGEKAGGLFIYGFPQIREEFKDDKLRPDLVKMAQAAGENAGGLFKYGFSEIREEFKEDKLRPDLVKMAQTAGEHAGYLIKYGFPEIREEFKKEGYSGKTKEYFDDLVKMDQSAGSDAYFLIKYGFPEIREIFKARHQEYVGIIQELKNEGFGINDSLVIDLGTKKIFDKGYIAILKNEKDTKKADKLYLEKIQKIGSSHAKMIVYEKSFQMLSKVYEVSKNYNLTEASEEIILNRKKEVILPLMKKINDLHDQPNEKRQAVIKDLPLEGYYDLIVLGAEEIFTSSFRDVVYPLVMKKMNDEKMDAVEFIKRCDPSGKDYRLLIQVFAKFGKLKPFLDTIKDKNKKSAFLHEFIFGLQADKDGVKNGIAISESLQSLEDKDLLQEVEEYVKEAYSQFEGQRKLLYGIIASMHEYNAKTNKEFFKGMSKTYQIENMYVIRQKELMNKDKEIIQVYYFYDDKDAQDSYNNMLSQYKSTQGWNREDKGKYIVLNKKEKGGTILKYINKPGHDFETGIQEMGEELKKKDLSAIQVVHRGHSFHAGESIKRILKTARIVFLGSCGGFNHVEGVLNRAEKAHIIATKGTGTMTINDPLLKLIDEEMLKGNGLEWNPLWKKAESKFKNNEYWHDYVNPSRNASVQFINAFRKYKNA